MANLNFFPIHLRTGRSPASNALEMVKKVNVDCGIILDGNKKATNVFAPPPPTPQSTGFNSPSQSAPVDIKCLQPLEAGITVDSCSSIKPYETPDIGEQPYLNPVSAWAKTLSLLSQEELVNELIKAHEKIHELEKIKGVPVTTDPNTTETSEILEETIQEGFQNMEMFHTQNFLSNTTSRPTFAYSSNTSSCIISNPTDGSHLLINELKSKLQNCKRSNARPKKRSIHPTEDHFIVAYECKEDFPNCDEDLYFQDSLDKTCDIINEVEENMPNCVISEKLIIMDEEDDDDDEDDNDEDEFPLIPSPVLNTPPYEYIFLTKENETKCRIYLNPKLNQIFQEELLKLHQIEDAQIALHQQLGSQITSEIHGFHLASHEITHAKHMDAHNLNHLVNCSSVNDVKNTFSASNVIHCFDPSDVDLELKRIFTEKPPVTHKIVRRKPRRERGSSVPAIDSYYGTKDLNKVGHASYFIPMLTEAERKAIGWKHEYHYGHWKYSTLNVPNPMSNSIPLHPHPHLEGVHRSKHNHIPHLPNHPHGIDLAGVAGEFLIDSEAASLLLESPASPVVSSCRPYKNTGEEDTLSFITLSGTGESSQSCHVIPDKSTLKKFLHWILPCLKATLSETGYDPSVTDSKCPMISLSTLGSREMKKFVSCKNLKNDKNQEETTIETIVEPSANMHSHVSQTHISFAMGVKSHEQLHSHMQIHSSLGSQSRHSNASRQSHHHHHSDEKSPHHAHQHHHHGFFHWKNILHHGTKSNESMSIIGGDVVESNPKIIGPKVNFGIDTEAVSNDKCSEGQYGTLREPINDQSVFNRNSVQVSSSCSDTDDEGSSGILKEQNKRRRKLKACKAYEKLLTLRDLGYQSNEEDEIEEDINFFKVDNTYADDEATLTRESEPEPVEESRKSCRTKYKKTKEPAAKSVNHRQIINDNKSGRPAGQTQKSVLTAKMLEFHENDGEDDISSGAGYPYQGSSDIDDVSLASGQIWEDDFETPQFSERSDDFVETRFLDPKDYLKLQSQEEKPGGAGELPFVYNFDYLGGLNGEMGVCDDYVDNVIEWMGQNFAVEVEEDLGLLNTCLDVILTEHDSLRRNKRLQANNNIHYNSEQQDDDIPAKVDGQHKIVTLNDTEINTMSDVSNDNFKN